MGYSTGCHTTFHHRYHIVWAPKYRYKVLHGEVRIRVREIIKQVCGEMGVTIINGALSRDHVHMFVEIPPHVAVSDLYEEGQDGTLVRVTFLLSQMLRHPWSEPDWHDAARCRARSNLYTVAVRDSCTNIPLAADKGSGRTGPFCLQDHSLTRSSHRDPPGLMGSWKIAEFSSARVSVMVKRGI